LAPQTCGADNSRLLAIPLKRLALSSSQTHRADLRAPARKRARSRPANVRRQILERMNREIDASIEQRFIELLGEEPFAAGFDQPCDPGYGRRW
jgi:hypothetical protein